MMANIVEATLDEHADAIQDATEKLISGQFTQAETIFRDILQKDSQHLKALQMLGILHAQTNRPDQGISFLEKALEIDPHSADALNNIGNVYKLLGQTDQAISSYKKASKISPEFLDPIANLGRLLVQLHRDDEAFIIWEEALTRYRSHLDSAPQKIEAITNIGLLLYKLQRYEEAVSQWSKLISEWPHLPDPHVNKALALMALDQLAPALEHCLKALAIRPGHVDAHLNAAACLAQMNQQDAAYEHCLAASAIQPNSVDVQCMTAGVLLRMDRIDEAMRICQLAAALGTDSPKPYYMKAVSCMALERDHEAVEWFEKALTIVPENIEYRFNQGYAFLRLGRYVEGFERHELRWDLAKTKCAIPRFPWPRLKNLAQAQGCRIFVFHEQGLGDTLQFIRYIPLLTKVASEVYLSVLPSLGVFLTENARTEKVVYSGEILPLNACDYQCSLMSIAHVFSTTLETIPAKIPYLYADPAKVLQWQGRLKRFGRSALTVGLVWSGNPQHKNDHHRSLMLEQLAPMLALDNVVFISLQKEVRASDAQFMKNYDNILYFGEELKDFSDTAALVQNMDLVISVDTSVAHLAGALGRPLWLMLPQAGDWRWHSATKNSPWYPTAKLFRQSVIGDWTSVIELLTKELKDYRMVSRWIARFLS